MSKQDMLFTASNLEKLAGHIEQNVAQDQLNMKAYRSDGHSNVANFVSIHNCGTCGCALGWSPFHPDMPAEKWMFEEDCFNWNAYFSHYYPSLSNEPRLNVEAFGANQSSDKPSVIYRLRDVADELRERAA